MINVTSKREKVRLVAAQNRRMIRYENAMFKDVKRVILKQYNSAIKTLRSMSLDTDGAIDGHKTELGEIMRLHYFKIAEAFGDDALQDAGFQKTKGPFEEYMLSVERIAKTYVAKRVTQITKTTKDAIKRIVRNGFDNGLSNAQIAKKISKIKNIATLARAKRIARTETHSVANSAMREAMKSTRIIKEKEWVSIGDDRTRSVPFDHFAADGERVEIEEAFQQTGEPLMVPGDPNGSAGNIINCRCGQMFHTRPEALEGGV